MEQAMTLDDDAILPEDFLLPLPPPLPSPFAGESVAGLDEFLQSFCGIFARSDQMSRFRAYILGLLVPSIRKNVGAMALALKGQFPEGFDPSQALQHFVTSSPWQEKDLTLCLKEILEDQLPDAGAVWLIHEAAFEKRGKNSIGVQRQYSRQTGKKLNCQLAVILARVGPRGYFPIASSLYLPSTWLENEAGLIQHKVPEISRQLQSKAQIALGLLEALGNMESAAQTVVVESSYCAMPGFEDLLKEKGLALQSPSASRSLLAQGYRHFEWMKKELGIDHFEGRTWRGWHHHVHLVFAALTFHILRTRGN
jgi:SRSO17 transposase